MFNYIKDFISGFHVLFSNDEFCSLMNKSCELLEKLENYMQTPEAHQWQQQALQDCLKKVNDHCGTNGLMQSTMTYLPYIAIAGTIAYQSYQLLCNHQAIRRNVTR